VGVPVGLRHRLLPAILLRLLQDLLERRGLDRRFMVLLREPMHIQI
jgi:hypothetical protein